MCIVAWKWQKLEKFCSLSGTLFDDQLQQVKDAREESSGVHPMIFLDCLDIVIHLIIILLENTENT